MQSLNEQLGGEGIKQAGRLREHPVQCCIAAGDSCEPLARTFDGRNTVWGPRLFEKRIRSLYYGESAMMHPTLPACERLSSTSQIARSAKCASGSGLSCTRWLESDLRDVKVRRQLPSTARCDGFYSS